jgi:pyruvate dehydrogenase E2 component (dihydrolipoamide acetyltransferase)
MASIQAITMPKWGMTMVEGKLVRWLADEGKHIATGQEVMEVETEKITNVVESTVGGTIRRIVVGEGMTAPVGALLAVLAEPDVPEGEVDAFVASYADRVRAAGEAAPAAPAPRQVEADGYRLNVLSLGEGERSPVVLLHGFGGDIGAWIFNQDALAAERPVHLIDLPAHGASDATVPSGRVEDIATAVTAILGKLDATRAHLVGHSLGGAVALAIAKADPARVASLTLIAPAGIGPDISTDYLDGFLAADRRKPMKEVLGRLFAHPEAVSAEMVENVLRFKRRDGVPEGLAVVAGALAHDGRQSVDLRGALEGATVPALVIWGDKDAIIPANQSQNLPARIKVEHIGDAGHMPMMEAAGAVNRLILGHLAATGE